jgi:hypothetical protein
MTLAREAFAASLGRGAAVTVGMAAKDPVRVPEDPRYVKLLERCFCVAAVGVNCYVIQNMYEDREVIPFGALFPAWETACEKLLALNVSKAMMDPTGEEQE